MRLLINHWAETGEFIELVTIWPNALFSKFDITDHNYTYVMMMGFSQNLAVKKENKTFCVFVNVHSFLH